MIETYATDVAIGLTLALLTGVGSFIVARKRASRKEREKWIDRVEELETVLMTGGEYWFGDSVLDVIEAHNEKIKRNGEKSQDNEKRIEVLEEAIEKQKSDVEEIHERINKLREDNGLNKQ